jgi:phosphorylase kinase alpha/beta subunit
MIKHLLNCVVKSLSIRIIKKTQYKSGLFGASSLNVKTGYNKAWIRDNVFVSLGLEKSGNIEEAKKAYFGLLDALKKQEYKIDWAIAEKPDAKYKYIHARVDPITLEEIPEDWGNMQNDSIGGLLFKIGDLYKKGVMLIRDSDDLRIIQKLVYYLGSVEYWHDKDNGIWEENEEIHASSVGACIAGLKAVKSIVDIPEGLIEKGEETLNALLPRESETKETDLALLTLIYPFSVVNHEQKMQILNDIETKLVRKRGILRYVGDRYYNNGKEAEWTFGFPWLAIIYKELSDMKKYDYYMHKTYSIMNWKLEMPELYYGGTGKHNENSPLTWSQAMFLCAIG